VLHCIDREYPDLIDKQLNTSEKVVLLARAFRKRLTTLVANWIRVGFCQGNFNSDNCAVGGFTLDYGPFGFIDAFNPYYQSWTGGGHHFSFLNQGVAAQRNFDMFCKAVQPLLASDQDCLEQLEEIQTGFSHVMQEQMEKMWASKLGLSAYHSALFEELQELMARTPVDYTIFFRELSSVPDNIEPLKKSFYRALNAPKTSRQATDKNPEEIDTLWTEWLVKWKTIIKDDKLASSHSREELSMQMKLVNPKYSLREWFVAPAYQQAATGNYSLVRELQELVTQPYAEQSKEVEDKYFSLKPLEFFAVGGLSHYSCSS
jgi:uncharacterized protein YdiU (UPF0061 family)